MEIAAVAAQDAMAGTRRASRVAEDGASLDIALEEQARLAAARDLLASLPPPVAQQIARRPASEGPPLAGLGELLEAVRDGSFVPGERELRSPFWRALDQAAAVFDGPDAMWATMRQILGSRDALASAVAHARAPQPGQPGRDCGRRRRRRGIPDPRRRVAGMAARVVGVDARAHPARGPGAGLAGPCARPLARSSGG